MISINRFYVDYEASTGRVTGSGPTDFAPPLEMLPDDCARILTDVPGVSDFTHFVDISQSPPVVLRHIETEAQKRKKAKRAVDMEAGRARARYATSVALQGASYEQKYSECKRFLESPGDALTADNYPYLYRRQQSGKNPVDEAHTVVNNGNKWRAIDAVIDDTRLNGKEAVDAAAVADIDSIVATYVAALKMV